MNDLSVPTVLGAVLLLALGAAEAPAQQSAADQLKALDRQWSQAFQEGDIDWIVNRHASEGRIMPPGAEAVAGRDAIREFWTGLYETEGLSLTWGPDEAHVADSGDLRATGENRV